MSDKANESEQPIIATFVDDLTSIRFMQGGRTIDPRAVLSGLATGAIKVVYEEEIERNEGTLMPMRIVSQTWRIVPKE